MARSGKKDRLSIEIDPAVKSAFTKACNGMGLSMTAATEGIILAWGVEQYRKAERAYVALIASRDEFDKEGNSEGFEEALDYHRNRKKVFEGLFYCEMDILASQENGEEVEG